MIAELATFNVVSTIVQIEITREIYRPRDDASVTIELTPAVAAVITEASSDDKELRRLFTARRREHCGNK